MCIRCFANAKLFRLSYGYFFATLKNFYDYLIKNKKYHILKSLNIV